MIYCALTTVDVSVIRYREMYYTHSVACQLLAFLLLDTERCIIHMVLYVRLQWASLFIKFKRKDESFNK